MQSNNATGNRSNPLLKGMILAAMGLAVSVSNAAPQQADSNNQGELIAIKVRGQQSKAVHLHTPNATSSLADVADRQAPYQLLLRNKVVVRAEGMTTVRNLIAQLPQSLGQVTLEGTLGNRTDAWELTTVDVRSAIKVAELLSESDLVRMAFVDSGQVADLRGISEEAWNRAINNGTGSKKYRSTIAPGIQPTDPNVDPAGTSDPSLASFWHLTNTVPMFLGRDNNVTQDIYDVMGYTGAGITVGLARPGNTQHLDSAHTDLDANYDAALTMPVDTTLLPPWRVLTAHAGIIAAERDNGVGGHGIAPNAQFATLTTGTDLQLANMLTYEIDNIDVKVIPSPAIPLNPTNEFTTFRFAAGYNDGAGNDYVGDFFRNSLRFGRNRKGSILVFSGGFSQDFDPVASMPFYPDNYDGGGFDDLLAGNELSIIDFDEGGMFTSPPIYIRAQTYMYPFASDRLTLLINGVDENGFADMNQAIGPAVFASVYTGTSNAMSYWDNGGTVPRGIFSTIPGSGTDQLPDQTTDWTGDINQLEDVVQVNGSSAAITGGIIALMLEANPNLSVRDIQHIFFESIFESPRSAAIRFPEFDPTRNYIGPGAQPGQTGIFSFWQINSGLHELPGGGVAAIRHSDQYGFGTIDAELAVSKAATWTGAPQLIVLDTGRVDEDSGTGETEEMRVPVTIADAQFNVVNEAETFLSPGDNAQIEICVRNNLMIEAIVVELTATGLAWNEVFTTLTSPWGTSSNLSYPTTRNAVGTSFAEEPFDDERDAVYDAGILGTDQMALIRHEFTTFKHWGELSGGNWRLNFSDFGPDSENEEGEPSSDMDPAIPNVHDLGVFGLPGSNYREEKEITSFRIKIYGYEVGEEPFLGCDPFNTSCPADLNADGVVSSADFNLFLSWYFAGDIRADLNDNGILDFFDISAYRAIFQPGFCTVGGGAPPFTGGRPRPGSNDAGDTNPPTRPI